MNMYFPNGLRATGPIKFSFQSFIRSVWFFFCGRLVGYLEVSFPNLCRWLSHSMLILHTQQNDLFSPAISPPLSCCVLTPPPQPFWSRFIGWEPWSGVGRLVPDAFPIVINGKAIERMCAQHCPRTCVITHVHTCWYASWWLAVHWHAAIDFTGNHTRGKSKGGEPSLRPYLCASCSKNRTRSCGWIHRWMCTQGR